MPHEHKWEMNVAGVSYHREACKKAAKGTMWFACREPDNPHDIHAVKIMACYDPNDLDPDKMDHVGYIPAALAVQLAPLIDNGARCFGLVLWNAEHEKGKPGLRVSAMIRSPVELPQTFITTADAIIERKRASGQTNARQQLIDESVAVCQELWNSLDKAGEFAKDIETCKTRLLNGFEKYGPENHLRVDMFKEIREEAYDVINQLGLLLHQLRVNGISSPEYEVDPVFAAVEHGIHDTAQLLGTLHFLEDGINALGGEEGTEVSS